MDAEIPAGLDVHVSVIDNRCTDDTPQVIARCAAENPGKVSLLYERRRGKSRALNAGIAATAGDLVGMIDDDEEVDKGWFRAINDAFQDESIAFVGGPYVAVWESPPPEWVPFEYLAVLGAVDNGSEPRDYGPGFPGILKGGNAVIRRRTLECVGPYAEWLGPSGAARLLSCEDEEMYQRLVKSGARGRYLPTLVIYHHVLASRLSPEYYRRWCFWRGVSRGLMDRRHRLPVPYLAGVPRFLYGRAARGFLKLLQHRATRQPWSRTFPDELSMWDLAGYFYGRHIYTLARFSPIRSRRRPR
jgi:glycosyltransferase involved in cell wall biosynthesis